MALAEILTADIEWLTDGSPYSSQFEDIYFSSQGGVAESEHVFIQGNNLKARWQQYQTSQDPFFLVELGFGTGLNFLLCWQLLDKLALDDFHLHYLAFEKHPLKLADLKKAQTLWPELEPYSAQLIALAVDHTEGLHRLPITPRITLDLYLGDAQQGLSRLFNGSSEPVDCWFMDGFAPSRNPDLWNDEIIKQMWRLSRPGATISTYSAAGQLRRSLQKVGFTLARMPGFGNKREMLQASKPEDISDKEHLAASPEHPRAHWYIVNLKKPESKKAVVVGAGIAGCSSAWSLARRGWQVTLIDATDGIATGASGNLQGVLQPRLAADGSAQAQFYLHALLYAYRQLNQMQQTQDIGWHPGGIIRLPGKAHKGITKLLQSPNEHYSSQVLTRLSRIRASELAGIDLLEDALFVPHGGWLRPARLCQAYLDQIEPGKLDTMWQTKVQKLVLQHDHWQVIADDNTVTEAPVVILSNSHQANRLPQTSFLSLLPVRGQLTQARSSTLSEKLDRVVVAEKYICPADNNIHSIGASYLSQSTDTSVNEEEDRENLKGIQTAFADPEQWQFTAAGARASVRCNTVDYLPVVGAVPDYQDFIDVYGELQRNAGATINKTANYQPGLYINTAHGSYGLASCPLAAEYIASLIAGESLPMTTDLADSLSPARFIIRELKKQKLGTESARDN